MRSNAVAIGLLPVMLLSACAVGPKYRRPTAPVPPQFKESAGQTTQGSATPPIAYADWWRVFNDPVLDGLERDANAANQAAIDAAKAAQARGKADANAANQAALLAAKSAKPSGKVTPTPTAQPTAAIAQPPAVQPTSVGAVTSGAGVAAGVTVEGQAPAVSADSVAAQGNEASLESVPVDQAQTSSDAA